jgi:periplasmic protein TonB
MIMSHLTRFLPRTAAAVALGALATGVLLLLMQYLIRSDGAAVDERLPGAELSFMRLVEDQPLVEPNRKPDQPPQPDQQPPPPRPTYDDESGAAIDGVDFTAPPPDRAGPVSMARVDGDALPIVKVTPAYPARALERGIEGYVLLQFTIDELGRVVDASVIDAQPRGVFDGAALKAVERFKYKPRVVDGRAIPVTGVQHLLTFNLSG